MPAFFLYTKTKLFNKAEAKELVFIRVRRGDGGKKVINMIGHAVCRGENISKLK